jgi:hypothetical protein
MKRPLAVAATAALALGAAGIASLASPAGAVGETVSITVSMDLPDFCTDGPMVFQVTDVTIGAGPELTGDSGEIVSNPCGWRGAVSVDVDPTTKQVTVATANSNTFQTTVVTVIYPGIGSVLTTSDSLWVADSCNMLTPPATAVTATGFSASWSLDPACATDGAAQLNGEGSAVFTWTDAAPTTTTTTTTEAPTTTTSAPAAAEAAQVTPAFTG